MKTTRNMAIAFLLNLTFAILEAVGGMLTGSVAVLSDAVHDIGDAAGIGLSLFLEKKSGQHPDELYTYGYGRYSVIGSVIVTLILLIGSVSVVIGAVRRLITPTAIHYDGMIVLAIVGVLVNGSAAFFTREGDSLNQKAVNLHMLEDVLGWIVVLCGAVVMRFTDWTFIDPLLSIGVAIFVLVNALRNLKEALDLFLEKTPHGLDVDEIKAHLTSLEGVADVHHVHLWSMDGHQHFATLHVVTDGNPHLIKEAVRAELREHGISHATLELEAVGEACGEEHCHPTRAEHHHHHHHHHHH